jgi:TRAP-type C4-dicarboxylate transport system substrate-binding protein
MRRTIATAVAVLAMWATAVRAQQQRAGTTLRIATLVPAGSAPAKLLDQLAADIDTSTHHRVTVTLYFAGPPPDEPDVVRKLKLGQLDGAELTTMGLAQISARISVLALPRLFASDAEADAVTQSMWPTFVAALQQHGYVLIDPDYESSVRFYSRAAIDSLGALQKTAVWQDPNDPAVGDLYAQLGITGHAMAAGAAADALAKGTLDAG